MEFFERWGLDPRAPARQRPSELHALLDEHGPLWIRSASPGGPVLVLTGIEGDGSPTGTLLNVLPAESGVGERLTLSDFGERLAEGTRQPEDRRMVVATVVQAEQALQPVEREQTHQSQTEAVPAAAGKEQVR